MLTNPNRKRNLYKQRSWRRSVTRWLGPRGRKTYPTFGRRAEIALKQIANTRKASEHWDILPSYGRLLDVAREHDQMINLAREALGA